MDDPGTPSLRREVSLSFNQSLQQSKKPSLLPSTSFRAASQLPRYSKFSLAMTTISSPMAGGKRQSRRVLKKDAFVEERDRIINKIAQLEASKEADVKAVQRQAKFLHDEFWKDDKDKSSAADGSAADDVRCGEAEQTCSLW